MRNLDSLAKSLDRTARQWLPSLMIVVGILVAWEAYVRVFDVQTWLLPAPSDIGAALYNDAGLLWKHTRATLSEIIVGFGLALACGVALATAIGLSRTLERAIYPFVIASQTIPIIVIAPMLLIWVGYGLAPKVIVVALISFFPIVVNMVDGLKSVDRDMANLLRTLGAHRLQVFFKVQAPTSLPYLFSGMRVAIAVSVIGAVIGEWVGSSEGLGLSDDPLQAAVPDRAGVRGNHDPVRYGSWAVRVRRDRRTVRHSLVARGKEFGIVNVELSRRTDLV